MKTKNIQNISLSELSFIIFSNQFSIDLQKDAYEELKRRFSKKTFRSIFRI